VCGMLGSVGVTSQALVLVGGARGRAWKPSGSSTMKGYMLSINAYLRRNVVSYSRYLIGADGSATALPYSHIPLTLFSSSTSSLNSLLASSNALLTLLNSSWQCK